MASVLDLVVPGAGTITHALSRIFTLSMAMKEAQGTCSRLHTRLQDICTELQKMESQRQLPPSGAVDKYVALVAAYLEYLQRYSQKSLVKRVARHGKMVDELLQIQEDVVALFQVLNLVTTATLMDWRKQWATDQQTHTQALAAMAKNDAAVMSELQGARTQVSAVYELQFELQRKAEQRSDEISRLLQRLLATIVRASNVKVSKPPPWLLQPEEVQYDPTPFACGSFGSFHRGVWGAGTRVVVTCLHVDDAQLGERALRRIKAEMDLWYRLNHLNVVKMFGASHVSSPPFMVCQDATGGNLCGFLERSDANRRRMWRLLYQAALGLDYMHRNRVVHGELKLNNILVGADGLAKLANFGLSYVRTCSTLPLERPDAPKVSGGLRWRAPECLRRRPTFASDVYSFAMCMIEAATGKPPFWFLDNDDDVRAALRAGDIPDHPEGIHDGVWRVVVAMTSADPKERMALQEVVDELKVQADAEEAAERDEQATHCGKCFFTIPAGCAFCAQCGTSILDGSEGQGGDSADESTPLLLAAAESGDEGTVRCLLALGASRRATDVAGKTPLMLAVENGHLDVVRCLTSTIEDLNARNSKGETALMLAIKSNDWDITRLLVDRGADVKAADEDGWTPLMYAISKGNAWAVEYLVEHSADVDTADIGGKTPLTYALTMDYHIGNDQSHTQVAEYLLSLVSERPPRPDSFEAATGVHEAPGRKERPSEGQAAPVEDGPEWLHRREELLVNRWTRLGAGGFGQVYCATWLNSDVVVKEVITPSDAEAASSFPSLTRSASCVDNQLAATDDPNADMFRREANIWYRLNHPHIVQLFGACFGDSSGSRPLFVCEYATNGSLNKYLTANPDQLWLKLYEVALAVQYLHQRGIVHGDLKCNNMVVGSDLKAKVTDFGLSSVLHQREEDAAQITGAVQWVAPECLGDDRVHATLESDVYALGMCIIEAVRITEGASSPYPWGDLDASVVKYRVKRRKELPSKPTTCTPKQWQLVSQMCASDPRQRLQIATVAYVLEGFAATPDAEPGVQLSDTPVQTEWRGIFAAMKGADDLQRRLFHQLRDVLAWFDQASRPRRLATRFHNLLKHFRLAIDHGFRHYRIVNLSSEHPAPSNIRELARGIRDLWRVIEHVANDGRPPVDRFTLPYAHIDLLISADPPVWLVTNDLESTDDRRAFVTFLDSEVDRYDDRHSRQANEVIQLALDAITSQVDADTVVSKPRWFIPWYELEIDESNRLGKGGFGTVYRAKWLDSDVVVKRMNSWGSWELSRSPDVSLASSNSSSSLHDSATSSIESRYLLDDITFQLDDSSPQAKTQLNDTSLKLFQREADIWFSLSHPHVVRLYGACHIGDPFFACEFASSGSLCDYLRVHPDQLWPKLYQVALGVGYLHARGVVHGDLKCNNIVVGGDGKAKVTDFGLSSLVEDQDESIRISDAWQWVAPECLEGARPTRQSDIYSLGMCIIEALRVVEASRLGLTEDEFPRYPWGARTNDEVKIIVTECNRLPKRLPSCDERHWELVTSMCRPSPGDRVKIDVVVNRLGEFQQ